jgi:hypothetical protein
MRHCRVAAAVVVALGVVVAVAVAAPFMRDYLIDSIALDEGTRLKGSATSDCMSISVHSSCGGDVDGDGVADFVVGAFGAQSLSSGDILNAGHAYVLYGVANASNAAAASAWPIDTTIKAIAQDNSTRGRIIDGANPSI